MLESNIRIVYPGKTLYIWVRRARLSGTDLNSDLVQKACGTLRYKHGLAAVPVPDNRNTLLVASRMPIKPIHLEQEAWELDVSDAGESSKQFNLSDSKAATLIPQLIERALLSTLSRHTNLWTLDSSRIWYEDQSFRADNDVAAYTRYEVAATLIDEVGIGIAVDISTAFFTVKSLAYFFESTIPSSERQIRTKKFTDLTGRQEGQKGTLMYDNGRNRSKCYFESAPEGATCSTTGKIRVRGQSYNSLLEYYREVNPELSVHEDTPAVRVSFRGIDRPQFVAADHVYVRVMNENVPESMTSVDKIKPAERRELLIKFWEGLGSHPLGDVAPRLLEGFWRPPATHTDQLKFPTVIFGDGKRLEFPQSPLLQTVRDNYRDRMKYLNSSGCYSVPAAITRNIFCAYPKGLDKDCIEQFASDVAEDISHLTKKRITATTVEYDSIADAAEKLRDNGSAGLALFVLNDDPISYYESAYLLPHWSVKRLTSHTLGLHYRYLKQGVPDRRSGDTDLELGKRRWKGFVALNTLDVLQLLEVVPFRIDRSSTNAYEAHLVIDVGHDQRHFALSLLLIRDQDNPEFRIDSRVYPKTDHQSESINPIVLEDQILQLFDDVLHQHTVLLDSLLVIRDGRFCGHEIEGVDAAVSKLKDREFLAHDARVDLVDLHKETAKSIRVWEIDKNNQVDNPLEGSLIYINQNMIILTSTGAATLHQGTADPLMIVANGHCSNLLDATRAIFAGSQLNWASPSVAQRLHIALKRVDEISKHALLRK